MTTHNNGIILKKKEVLRMLTPEGYKKRLTEKQLDEYMQTFGAVCIEGPKYCGKTWTARSRSESAAFIGDPAKNFQTIYFNRFGNTKP